MPKFTLKIATLCLILLGVAAFVIGLLLRGVPVETRPVERGVAIDAVPATVEVGHASIVTLSGEEDGRIVESKLKVGERVEEGDWLLRVDDTDLQLEAEALRDRIRYLEQRAELRMQQTIELARAEEELANHEKQYAAGNYAELQIKRRRREFEASKENH